MSEPKTSSKRPTLEQLLADLLVKQTREKLPRIVRADMSEDGVRIRTVDTSAVLAWHRSLGGGEDSTHLDSKWPSAWGSYRGWDVSIDTRAEPGTATPLDADALAELAALADAPSPVPAMQAASGIGGGQAVGGGN